MTAAFLSPIRSPVPYTSSTIWSCFNRLKASCGRAFAVPQESADPITRMSSFFGRAQASSPLALHLHAIQQGGIIRPHPACWVCELLDAIHDRGGHLRHPHHLLSLDAEAFLIQYELALLLLVDRPHVLTQERRHALRAESEAPSTEVA